MTLPFPPMKVSQLVDSFDKKTLCGGGMLGSAFSPFTTTTTTTTMDFGRRKYKAIPPEEGVGGGGGVAARPGDWMGLIKKGCDPLCASVVYVNSRN